MARKKETKDERLGIRISTKLRFGLDLIARKYRISESEAVARCVEMALDFEGFSTLDDGELFSRLDLLWSPSPAMRALKVAGRAPELATQDEIRIFSSYKSLLARYKNIVADGDLFGPYRVTDELVSLISAYLGITPGSSIPSGDESAFLEAADLAVLNAHPELHDECRSLEGFREKYIQ